MTTFYKTKMTLFGTFYGTINFEEIHGLFDFFLSYPVCERIDFSIKIKEKTESCF